MNHDIFRPKIDTLRIFSQWYQIMNHEKFFKTDILEKNVCHFEKNKLFQSQTFGQLTLKDSTFYNSIASKIIRFQFDHAQNCSSILTI